MVLMLEIWRRQILLFIIILLISLCGHIMSWLGEGLSLPFPDLPALQYPLYIPLYFLAQFVTIKRVIKSMLATCRLNGSLLDL